jgi:outer membrane murein-binding lipoprotein Lpp
MTKNIFYLFAAILLMAAAASCVSSKKIRKLSEVIEQQKQLEAQLAKTMTGLDSIRTIKQSTGAMDDSTANTLKKYLEKEITASQKRNDTLADLSAKLKENVKPREFKSMTVFVTSGTQIVSQKQSDIILIDDLLKQEVSVKFNTATFFGPGGYKIPPENLEKAKVVFSPVIDSLISFIRRYPGKSIVSSVISSGYADEQGIRSGTELWRALTDNLRNANASRQELNKELSRLRAVEVSSILSSILKEKVKQFPEFSNTEIRFITVGKGEEYPNKNIKDYNPDDERRRIVVIFWSSVPKL